MSLRLAVLPLHEVSKNLHAPGPNCDAVRAVCVELDRCALMGICNNKMIFITIIIRLRKFGIIMLRTFVL